MAEIKKDDGESVTVEQMENFLDMVCHELRNPMSSMLQSSEYALQLLDAHIEHGRPLDLEVLRELQKTIMMCMAHQKRVVDDCLNCKINKSLVTVRPLKLQPITVIYDCLKILEAQFRDSDISISRKTDESFKNLDINWILADPARISQVLINLLTNAIKFTKDQPNRKISIKIGASPSIPKTYGRVVFPHEAEYADLPVPTDIITHADALEDDPDVVYLMFSVKDSGIGISEDHITQLFRRFVQVPNTEQRYGGSGLGLFISRELSRLMGGDLGVHSDEGVGSTFAFYIKCKRVGEPLSSESEHHYNYFTQSRVNKKSRPSSVSDQQVSMRSLLGSPITSVSPLIGYRILIVEDNVVNQKIMQQRLSTRGCTAYTADDGEQALSFLLQSNLATNAPSDAVAVDLVLMDCQMPVMDGIEATRQIRALEQEDKLKGHVPIIGISGTSRTEATQEMLDAGMDDIIVKPFMIQELVEVVDAVIKNSNVQKWSDMLDGTQDYEFESPVRAPSSIEGEMPREKAKEQDTDIHRSDSVETNFSNSTKTSDETRFGEEFPYFIAESNDTSSMVGSFCSAYDSDGDAFMPIDKLLRTFSAEFSASKKSLSQPPSNRTSRDLSLLAVSGASVKNASLAGHMPIVDITNSGNKLRPSMGSPTHSFTGALLPDNMDFESVKKDIPTVIVTSVSIKDETTEDNSVLLSENSELHMAHFQHEKASEPSVNIPKDTDPVEQFATPPTKSAITLKSELTVSPIMVIYMEPTETNSEGPISLLNFYTGDASFDDLSLAI